DPALTDEINRYGLELTQVPDAWNLTRGSAEVIIAILDSGLDLNHPEFAGRVVDGYDFVNNDSDPSDDSGHGTHAAGIAAAAMDDGNDMVGVCPECKVLPVKVLNEHGAGTWSTVVRGILYAVDRG